jgi:hypothetical protein
MYSFVSIEPTQVLALHDQLLLDGFAILMLLVLFIFSANSRRNRTGNLRSIQKPLLEWPACRVPDNSNYVYKELDAGLVTVANSNVKPCP